MNIDINNENDNDLNFESIVFYAKQNIKTENELFIFEKKYFSKENGLLTKALSSLGKLQHEERKKLGIELNILKNKLSNFFIDFTKEIKFQELNKKISSEKIDVTAPSNPLLFINQNNNLGYIHPITKTINELHKILIEKNFTIFEGCDIEDDMHNFTYLNTPAEHPARSMHDTIYIDEKTISNQIMQDNNYFHSKNLLLRTHTSPSQIRISKKIFDYLKKKNINFDPIANSSSLKLNFASIGKTYRNDNDATHSPMFHQIEAVGISNDMTCRDLMSILADILKKFFNDDSLEIRIRSSYFPFTQPSWEVDLFLKKTNSWVEVLGCGMMHPNVIKNLGINPEKTKAYAFGAGIERLCMLKNEITDLRILYSHNLPLLKFYSL
jgi:phenylalanyl-tRNA synthetase alpha chain